MAVLRGIVRYHATVAYPKHWSHGGQRPDTARLGKACFSGAVFSGTQILINHAETHERVVLGTVGDGSLLVQDRTDFLYVEWRIPSDISATVFKLYRDGRLSGLSPGAIVGETKHERTRGKVTEHIVRYDLLQEISVLVLPSRPVWPSHLEVT